MHASDGRTLPEVPVAARSGAAHGVGGDPLPAVLAELRGGSLSVIGAVQRRLEHEVCVERLLLRALESDAQRNSAEDA